MSEENKSALVPRLRFPEFQEAGEWEEVALGDVCERIMDGTHFSPASKSGPFLYLTSKNVRPGALVLDDVSYISEEEHSSIFSRCPVKKNDLLLTKDGASTGNCTLNPLGFEFSLLSSVAVIRGNSEKILQEFLAQDFQAPHIQDQIADAISGQAITRITLEKIKLFKVWLTSSHEQQKIADCLSSLDELITAETQKLAALKTHKKGLMQQLFPREGETVPRLRFPEFREAGEWQRRKASDLVTRSVRRVDVDVDAMYQEIGIRSHGKGVFHKEPLSGKALGDKRVFWVEQDVFVVNIVFAWEQAIAVTSAAENGMIASHRFPMYEAKKRKSDVNFIKYFFLTKKGKELLGIASPGGAGRNKTLGQKDFGNLEFLSPEDVEEQAEIARCLSSLDELITAETQKLDALKTHKKGLMQQLFPSVGGVAGEA